MYSLTPLLLFLVAVNCRVNPDGPTVVTDTSNCLTNLIGTNFKKSGVLIFATADNYGTTVAKIQEEVLKRLNKKLTYAIEIMNPEEKDYRNKANICDNYDEQLGVLHIDSFDVRSMPAYLVIIIDEYIEFQLLLKKLLRSRSWNPKASFIVLLFNVDKENINIEFVERIVTCLFRYNATEIIIIVPDEKDIRKAIIYSWKPIDPPKYCGYFNETAKNRIYVHNICEKGNVKMTMNIRNEFPKDLKGCVLDIIALERQPFISLDKDDSNVERLLIDEIARTYNIRTNYTFIENYSRGERENGDWDGALKLLIMKKGQILLGGIFPDFDVHEDFECSVSYLADSYTWVVPKAEDSPPWIALVIIFKHEVWYSVVACFIICALTWNVLGQLGRDSQYNKSLRHNFMNAWCCSLGFCCYIRPKRLSLRIFFSVFNFYCVLVITSYQAKLIDVLKNPTSEYQIQNVEDLIGSGLQFGGSEELHDLFENRTDIFDSTIFENWVDVVDMEKALLDVAVYRNFSVLCSRLELAHLTAVIPDLSDKFGNRRYYEFNMNMFTVPVEMIALRGFAYMDLFSTKIEPFKQMGITAVLRGRFAWFNDKRRANLLRILGMENADVKALTLQQLEAGFMILILGYTIVFIVFILEIIVTKHWFKHRVQLFNNKFKTIYRR